MSGFGIPEKGQPNWTEIPANGRGISGQWDAANPTGTQKITDIWVQSGGHTYDIHQTQTGSQFFVDGKSFATAAAGAQKTALNVMGAVYAAPDFHPEGQPAFDLPALPEQQTALIPNRSSRGDNRDPLASLKITREDLLCGQLRHGAGNLKAFEANELARKNSAACKGYSPS